MKAYCPHCFERTNRPLAGAVHRSVFRCVADSCRAIRDVKRARVNGGVKPFSQGEALEDARDPVAEAHGGEQRKLKHTFEVRGLKPVSRGRCPVSRQWSSVRLCPVCHSEIHPMNGLVEDLPFSLIGAPDAGKSSYIAALIAHLNGAPGGRFGLSAGGLGDTRDVYDVKYRPLVGKWDEAKGGWADRHIEKTDPVANRGDAIRPLVYSIKRPPSDGRVPRAITLSLFDPPGEDLVRGHIEQFHAFIYRCAGLTFLVDGAGLLGAGQFGAKLAPAQTTLEAVADKVEAHGRSKPLVAIAVSKADLLVNWGLLPRDFEIEPTHAGGYDEAASRKHSALVEKLLASHGGQGLVNLAKNSFGPERVRFFAISSFGAIAVSPSGDPQEEIRPVRVCEPFFWLLSESGLVPRKAL